ncbi:MAG: RHS repeat domain-containing protein [Janthinobacterium lividum]
MSLLYGTSSFLQLAIAQTAQGAAPAANITSVVHPAPNAASLGKFSDIPVSLYTGIPTVAVPLWQIKQGDISVDVSLSYHGGGIKVEDVASWVGMGWALNAGGAISRSARGLPDDPAGYQQTVLPRQQSYIHNTMSAQDKTNFILNLSRGVEDAEPDVYHILVGGISARFFMGDDGQYIVAPRELNLRVRYDITEPGGQRHKWVITDAKGVQYKFDEVETNVVSSIAYSNGQGTDGSYSGQVDSSWYLTEIEDTKGNQVNFAYAREGSSLVTKGSEYVNVPSIGSRYNCDMATGFQIFYSDISTVRLASISNGREKLVFVPDAIARQDQSGYGLALVQVQYDGVTKKQFRFYKSYFQNEAIGTSTNFYSTTQDHYRLRLDSLREEAGDMSSAVPAYRFTYNRRPLPYKNSLAQDHWGFYNGQDNTTGVTYKVVTPNADLTRGANKEPDAAYASAGLLTAVTYPTGGSTEFTYEPNTYLNTLAPVTLTAPLANLYGVSRADSLTTRFVRPFEVTQAMVTGGQACCPGYATVLTSVQIDPPGPANGYYVNLRIINTDAGAAVTAGLGGVQTLQLRAGHYALIGEITTEYITDPANGTLAPTIVITASLAAQLTYAVGTLDMPGPGLRLKQLTKRFGQGVTEVRTYEYQDSIAGHSSGRLGNLPNYQSTLLTLNETTLDPFCPQDTYASVSHYPLINSTASYVGYGRVTEYYDAAKTQGKKVYTYTNFDLYNDTNYATSFPFVPASSQEWKRGLLLTEDTYSQPSTANTNQAFDLQEHIKYTYERLANSAASATGIKVAGRTSFVGAYDIAHYLNSLSIEFYPILSDSYQLRTKSTTLYQQHKAFTSTETHSYTPAYFQPSKVSSLTSDGSISMQRYYYPTDYISNRAASPLLEGLLTANRVNLPIEELSSRGSVTAQRLTGGKIHEYAAWTTATGVQRYYEQRQHTLNTARADSTQRYDFLHVPGHYEEQLHITGITSRSEPTSYRQQAKEKTAYQWGYEERYPVAMCKNATLTEFYYEGFENTSTAQTGLAHAGHFYFLAPTYTVSWLPPNARAYVLRYWYRVNGTWRYQQQRYTGSSQALTGGDAYDEVSICPQDAQLTTYTYDPLVGMTSQTDPAGRTTTYEYDNLGRLLRTRDEQGRILSQQQYHYAGTK